MSADNSVTLMGRLTAEPETQTFGTGSSVVKFRLAVGRSKKDKNTGAYDNSNTCYIDCTVWKGKDGKGGLHDVVLQYVKKGDQVLINGELKFEQWEEKGTGAKRSKHTVNVRDLTMLGGKGGDGEAGERQAVGAGVSRGGGYSPPDDDGSGVPF